MDTFSTDDILRNWEWKGQKLPDETIEALKGQAKALRNSLLWKILKAELEWFAVKSLIENGQDKEDIHRARMFGNIVQQLDLKLKSMGE